ncbi:MAG: hypothetical protein JXA69_10410 [Phycisphaerae bacterium]|nr:hypothetical protein [Phycisphaerae bacterium]
MRSALVSVAVCSTLLSAAQLRADTPHLVAHWDLRTHLDDRVAPISELQELVGRLRRTETGVEFDGRLVQGLLYGAGVNGELSHSGDFTWWVQAAFGSPLDQAAANHDTLLSRWGIRGDYGALLRSDHRTGTLHLFVSPDGQEILDYDSHLVVDRSGKSHDLAVVFRAGRDVRFFIDGRWHCTLHHPSPPATIHTSADNTPPFAIGYNADPAADGRHEVFCGVISAVRVYDGAIDEDDIARLSGLRAADARQEDCRMVVNVDDAIGVVHPFVFGGFLEHFQDVVYGGVFDRDSPHTDELGLRGHVVDALAQLKLPVLRWPGGNFTSAYHWRWGAVPRKYRPTIYAEPVWKQKETNEFGTIEFVELCRRVGAEPLICVGVGRDPRCPTAEEAAAWVRYCNATRGAEAELRAEAGHPDPLDVMLWGLGNEVSGPWQVGYYSKPEEYADDLVRYATAMRRADPQVRFIICGESYKADNRPWNRTVLTPEVARLADWISHHTYTHLGSFGPQKPYEAVFQQLLGFERDVAELVALNREVSRNVGRAKPLELAVDEWNEYSWGNRADNARPEHYSLRHALFTAGVFNVFLRRADAVTMANYSPSVNCRGSIYADDRGVLLRSTHHVITLYRRAAGGTAVRVDVKAPTLVGCAAPVIDATAVLLPDGNLRVYITQRDPTVARSCRIELRGFQAAGSSASILTASSLDAFNDFENPRNVTPQTWPCRCSGRTFEMTLPPRTLLVLDLER